MFREWLEKIKEREAAHEFKVGFSHAAYRILHCGDDPAEYKYLELFGPHYDGEEAARVKIQELQDEADMGVILKSIVAEYQHVLGMVRSAVFPGQDFPEK